MLSPARAALWRSEGPPYGDELPTVHDPERTPTVRSMSSHDMLFEAAHPGAEEITMVALPLSPSADSARPRCAYQAQDSQQTLAEGLAEYYAVNGARVSPPPSLPPVSRALFRNHDICHVIFGLDTTLEDEGMADVRTLLSCDVGWRRYARYMTSDPQAKAIFKELGYARAVWTTLAIFPRMARAIWEAWRMSKRWPWDAPAHYFDRSLADLRRQYGIRVI